MRFEAKCPDAAMNKIRKLLCRKQKLKYTAFNPFLKKFLIIVLYFYSCFLDSKVMYVCLLLIYAVQNEEYLIKSIHHQYKTN